MLFKFLIYNKFKKRKWKRLSYQKRANAYQDIEKIQAKKQHRKVYRVVFEDLDSARGLCCSNENTIKLNIYFLEDMDERFVGMATLFHEGRHAYQDHVVDGKKKWYKFKQNKWRKNMEGYLNNDNDKFSFYAMQPIERDAEAYAIKCLKKLRFRYGNDPSYVYALEQRSNSFVERKENAIKELGVFYKFRVAFHSWVQRLKNKRRRK